MCIVHAGLFVTLTFNGTFYARAPITDMACMSRYSDAFKKSFTTVIRHAQHAMKYRRLCASVPAAAYSIALRPSAIKLVAISNMVYNVASLYHLSYSLLQDQPLLVLWKGSAGKMHGRQGGG